MGDWEFVWSITQGRHMEKNQHAYVVEFDRLVGENQCIYVVEWDSWKKYFWNYHVVEVSSAVPGFIVDLKTLLFIEVP